MNIAIVGIHTGIGKTLASAIICEAIQADYWKPVQAGSLDHSDSDEVKGLITNTKTVIHPEAFRLSQPLSPHAAAKIDNKKIEIENIAIPVIKNHLVIETAGGLMSPINDEQTNLDLIRHFNLPVILISQNYLGSINHSLLTLTVLKSNGVNIKGILFNGDENLATQQYILNHSKLTDWGRIDSLKEVTKGAVAKEARLLALLLIKLFHEVISRER